MLSMSFVAFADLARQKPITQEPNSVDITFLDNSVESVAAREAFRDVERDLNKPMWFAIGCLFPGVGLLTPYFYKPPIPAGSLLGKSPEYVAHYSDAYNREMEKRQFSSALGGCVVGGIAYSGCFILSVSANVFSGY